MNKLYIIGPTASGKTSLAINVAKRMNGEIIAADSRTVYKGMDIGTAKPTLVEMQGVKHYCLDLVEPSTGFTVADFVTEATSAFGRIENARKLPIVVGGSGLFVDSLLYEYTFMPPNLKAREKFKDLSIEDLTKEVIKQGIELPENNKNKRYLQHALERKGQQGSRLSTIRSGTTIVGINPPKEVLLRSIRVRAEQMLNSGVKEEAVKLFGRYSTKPNAFNGGIYKLLPRYINGEISRDELIDLIVISDIQLAKKQMTWFKRNKDIVWFDSAKLAEQWLVTQSSDRIE